MNETEKVILGLLFVALAALVIYNKMGTAISVSPLAAGAGPAPNSSFPPGSTAQAAFTSNVSPWGSAPPLMPMIRRSSGVSGISTNDAPSWSLSCGGRCN